MLDDIGTMIWKEFKEIVQGSSKSRGGRVTRMLIPIALVGVFLPLRIGSAYFTSPAPLMGIAWILPMVGIGLTVDAFAGERERRTLETLLASRLSDEAILLGKLAASVLYAWGLLTAALALAVVTVNLTHPNGTLQFFSPAYGVSLLVFGLLLATFVCNVAVLVSLRASTVRQASQNLAFGMMGVYLAAIVGFEALSRPYRLAIMLLLAGGNLLRAELVAGALLVTLNLALLGIAKARFQRARLILD